MTSREDKIAAVVAKAPPLTLMQRVRLLGLLNPTGTTTPPRTAEDEARDAIARGIADDQ